MALLHRSVTWHDGSGTYHFASIDGDTWIEINRKPEPEDEPKIAELFNGWTDDEGNRGESLSIIENGVLLRTLGGASSQQRCDVPGVASSRASDWNRPPIDRMANLNLEPGTSNLEEMIGSIQHGVYMKTNQSWSIDDSRNKFQFGCELGRLIEDGELKDLVRNPGYRGISANFWRNLTGVGDRDGARRHS